MHNSQNLLSSINLEFKKEFFPGLVHAFNMSKVSSNGTFAEWRDEVGDVVINMGLTANISAGPDAYSYSSSVFTIDQLLSDGTWVQPGTKTVLVVSMFSGSATGPAIIGHAAPSPAGDGLRCNRTSVTAYDHSEVATATATPPALASSAAMVALRLTPAVDINSINVDETNIVVNAPASAATVLSIDDLQPVIGLKASEPYWGLLVFHFDNPPSDKVIAEGMAYMRPEWLKGNFIAPPMWKDYK